MPYVFHRQLSLDLMVVGAVAGDADKADRVVLALLRATTSRDGGARYNDVHALFADELQELQTVPGACLRDVKLHEQSFQKAWTFPPSAGLQVVQLLKRQNFGVHLPPKDVLELVMQPLLPPPTDALLAQGVTPAMFDTMYPYQRQGLRAAVRRRGRMAFFDDMGVGKSLQSLAVMTFFAVDWPCLVVCPSSMTGTWQKEALRFCPWIRGVHPTSAVPRRGPLRLPKRLVPYVENATVFPDVIVILKGDDVPHAVHAVQAGHKCLVVVSYSLLHKHDALQRLSWGMMVCDESHKIKNADSLTAQAVLRLSKRVRRMVLASGTAATSGAKELFTQLQAVNPRWKVTQKSRFMPYRHQSKRSLQDLRRLALKQSPDYREDLSYAQQPKTAWFTAPVFYALRYCQLQIQYTGRQHVWKYDSVAPHTVKELGALLSLMSVRRLYEEVLPEMPPLRRHLVWCDEVEDDALAEIQTLLQEKKTVAETLGSRKADEMYMQAVRLTCRAKMQAALRYLTSEWLPWLQADNERKLLIFMHTQACKDAVCELMRTSQIGYIRIDGHVPPQRRSELVTQFQEDARVRVGVLGIKAAGEGLTLTAASVVVFLECSWSPADHLQAEKRAHRIGQKADEVLAYYFMARGTTDENLWRKLQRKMKTVGKMLDDCDNKRLRIERVRDDDDDDDDDDVQPKKRQRVEFRPEDAIRV